MLINADFAQRVVVRMAAAAWTRSPCPGVERMMLDRVGGEIARATSFVRFAPGSAFVRHDHGGGEEILVIEGSFDDENGAHAAGAYIRDPPGSIHTPSSPGGCLLFVKLRQFDAADSQRVEINTEAGHWRMAGEGCAIQPLHAFAGVTTFMVRLDAGATVDRMIHLGGEEMVVLTGSCAEPHDVYSAGDWIRDPGGRAQALISPAGCTLFVKTGHLAAAPAAHPDAPIA